MAREIVHTHFSAEMNMRIALAAAILLAPGIVYAQSAAQELTAGDRDRATKDLPAALAHYEAAVAADSNNVEALWKAANAAVDLGEFDDQHRAALYATGDHLARLAVRADSGSSFAHFALAKALGRVALSKGKLEKVKYATAVHDEAVAAIRLDSNNAGALHVLGLWNAEVMRLSGIERFAAKNLLGGKILAEANWDNAQRLLERAVALEPDRIIHRLDLAGVYADRHDIARAREEYEAVLRLPDADYDDHWYKAIAERRLRDLR